MSSSILPKGSFVLVTGATGSVGGAVTLEILKAGYRVRAVVRNAEKGGYLQEGLRARGFDEDVVQIVHCPDMSAPGSLDKAMEGCIAVSHLASDVTFGHNPHEVITPTLALLNNVLETAAKTSSVKRFVYTSSSAVLPWLTEEVHITPSSWMSDSLISDVWSEPFVPEKALIVYVASKHLAEKACWEFMRDRKPHFDLNAIVPNAHIGPALHPKLMGSFNGVVYGAFVQDPWAVSMLPQFPINSLINLEDSGLLHVAALTMSDVKGERLLGIGELFSHDNLIDTMAKVDPDRKLPPKLGKADGVAKATVDMSRSYKLTARLGKAKWTGLEESLRQCIESIEEPHGV